jgi:hypothetical protein
VAHGRHQSIWPIEIDSPVYASLSSNISRGLYPRTPFKRVGKGGNEIGKSRDGEEEGTDQEILKILDSPIYSRNKKFNYRYLLFTSKAQTTEMRRHTIMVNGGHVPTVSGETARFFVVFYAWNEASRPPSSQGYF